MPPPVNKQSSYQNELAKTIALLHTLLKRIERQDNKISDMQLKLSQVGASSSTTDSTPRRRSASDRRKEVPLEVRVSFKTIKVSSPVILYGISLSSCKCILCCVWWE